MKINFPYGEKSGQTYPLVDLTIFGQKTSLTVKALVDSGASFSVFRPEIAQFLDIPIEKGESMYLEGIGGRILGYLHPIDVRVATKRFRLKIIFSKEFTVSFNLLGRDNFFREFLVTFNEIKRRTILQ